MNVERCSFLEHIVHIWERIEFLETKELRKFTVSFQITRDAQ